MKKSGSLAAIASAVAIFNAVAFAQEAPHEKAGGMMMEDHGKMMQMHQKMESAWQKQDAELDKLIEQMKSATGDQKLPAIEAVVSKLVDLRKEEHEHMAAMHKKMESEMKGKMKGETENKPSPDEHSAHHPEE